jgi:DNA invertase Pin-like site-specific DNA recombinase
MSATRGVRYARQSKDKKVSITDQLAEAAVRFLEEGWQLAATLQDGKSASRHARTERDEWAELLGMVRGREVDVVWLWEASRGDRKNDAWTAFLALCRDSAVQVYVETDERLYNLELPRDMKIMANAGVDSEYESALIQARTIRAKNAARRAGDLRRVIGGRARFGWVDTEDGWAVDPDTAKVLQEAADRVIAGESLLAVHADLDQRGLLVDSHGERITSKRLRTTLLSPLAAGLMTKRDGTLMGQTSAGGPLDQHVWHRVQAVFASRRRGRPVRDCYPLGPVLRCGKCGNQLTGEINAHGAPSYACANPHPALGIAKGCRGTLVVAADVHAVIADRLHEWAQVSPRARALSVANLDLAPKRAELDAELVRLQQAQADLDWKRDRNRYDMLGWQRNNDALGRDFDRVEAEQAALSDAEASPLPVSIDWQAMTNDEKLRMTAEVFVTPIVVGRYRAQGTRASAKERIEPGLQLRR